MGKTSIEWATDTWNPIRGIKGLWHCTKVSEGCRSCYAERMNIRMGGPEYKPGADGFRLDEKILEQPLKWKRPRRIFVCSMTDLCHEMINDNFIARTFEVMLSARQHTFQVLTKRAGRMAIMIRKMMFYGPPSHIWLGVSVEDQKTADERIQILLETPAAVRWISAEPLLAPIDLLDYLPIFPLKMPKENMPPSIDWVVVGGESGPRARPMHPDWARSIRDQCQMAGVPFFFKQWGEWIPSDEVPSSYADTYSSKRHGSRNQCRVVGDMLLVKAGKKAAGRILDGKTWDEYPKNKEAP